MFRSNDTEQQASRPSIAGQRVARSAQPPAQEFLEPADSFDLGDGVSSAEAEAGEWLGRKAAAKSRRAKAVAEREARTFESGGASAGGRRAAAGAAARPQGGQEPAAAARPGRKGRVAKAKPKANRKKVLAIVGISLAAVLIACGAVAAFWAWDTWWRYDDTADIQGEWATANGATIVVIDSNSIHMPDSVDFAYTMNTDDKTISYTFAELSGGGSYAFSDDRLTLTITEADGSQTVFVKRSGDTSGEPRVATAGDASSAATSGTSGSAASATSDAATTQNDSDAALAPDLSEDESAEVAQALDSTSSEATPGANAVTPGSASLAQSVGA